MADPHRTPDHPLVAALQERKRDAAFHEIVRILEALPQIEDAVAVGHQGPPAREGIRFTPALDLHFGASEVDGIEVDAETGKFKVTSRFFSIYGAQSPLPAHYTEQLLYEDPDGHLKAFLDIFNHRLLSLRHRAWKKYRHSVGYSPKGIDPISQRMRVLAHVERLGEPLGLLRSAGLLHQQPLSEASFEQVLSSTLKVPVQVRSCHIRWIPIPEHQQLALGEENCTLGQLCALGSETRSASTTFQVRVGPLAPKDFRQYLPTGSRRRTLCDLIDRLNGDQLDCKISIEVAPEVIDPCWLGEESQGLGWNTWLGEDAPSRAPILGDTVSHTMHSPNNDPMVA